MAQKILITGVNGFVGKHLARELSSRNIHVIGVGHREATVSSEIASVVAEYYQCDVSDPEQVAKLPLSELNSIINLAGLANVGASFDSPELYMEVNVKVLSALGEALYEANPKARMIAVSTGALYDPNQPMPLHEDSQVITKGSPYALSKLAMEEAASELRKAGQDCIVVRPFNHIGPGQGLGFLIPDLASKLMSTDPKNPRIKAGNLKTIRDYTDVRDIAKAYADLATSETLSYNVYNVCSGTGRSGENIVEALCSALNIDYLSLEIDVDQTLIRPTDPAEIFGAHNNITDDTGWEPEIALSDTVKAIVESL